MRRFRNRQNLRGSVTQNNTLRMRAREKASFTTVMLRFGLLASALVVVLCVGVWLWHIGWPQREAGRLKESGLHLTQQAQFAIKDIVVEGRDQTSSESVISALGSSAADGAPILAFDPRAAQARIAKLPWVATATVERRLPNTILVHIIERVPLARWQHDNKTVVIDAEGTPLPDAKPEQFATLPLVVGSDAPAETQNLLAALENYAAVQQVMTAAVRVGERRWDLHLEPNIIARLPEKDVDGALKRLSDLITDKKILERNVAAIDLRLPDRLVIEPANGTNAPSKAGDEKL